MFSRFRLSVFASLAVVALLPVGVLAAEDAAEKIVERTMIEADVAKMQAESHAKRGELLLEADKYRDAFEAFQAALKLNPANERAIKGTAQASRYLSARSDVPKAAVQRELERARISEQHARMEAVNYIETANALLAKSQAAFGEGADVAAKAEEVNRRLRMLEKAAESSRRARLRLDSLPSRVDISKEKQALDALEENIEKTRAELERSATDMNSQVSLAKARETKGAAAEYGKKRKDEMLRKARVYRDMYEFDKSVGILEELLRLDPSDDKIESMLMDVRKKSQDYRRAKILDEGREERLRVMEQVERAAIPTVSPETRLLYPKNWSELVWRKQQKRQGQKATDEATRRIMQRMQERFSVTFEETPVQDALNHISRLTGVNIIFGQPDEDLEPISLHVRDMRLEHIMRWIMTMTNLSYEVRDEVVYITNAENLKGKILTEVYDVRDIAFSVEDARQMPGFDEEEEEYDEEEEDNIGIADIVRKVLQDDFAEGVGEVELNEGAGVLTVVNTAEAHKRVVDLLAKLRAAQAIQVMVSARFLTVEDDFWQEIRSEISDYLSDYYISDGNRNKSSSEGSMVLTDITPLTSVYGANLGSTASSADVGMVLYALQTGLFEDSGSILFMRLVRESEKTDELFAPHLIVYNNRQGWVRFQDDIPYVSKYQRASAGNDIEPVIEIVRSGASLQVRPTVSADKKYITLDIYPRVAVTDPDDWDTGEMVEEVNAIRDDGTVATIADPHLEFKLPNIQRKDVRTFATLPDGGSILISGLGVNVNMKARNGVPLLQDMPVLGDIFSRRAKQKEKKNVVVMVNARMILLDEEEAKQAE